MKLLTFIIFCSLPVICFPQALRTNSKKAKELFKTAESNYVTGKYSEAHNAIDEAIKKDQNFIDAYLLKAEIYQAQKDYNGQKSMLMEAISLDSMYFIPTYFNIGMAEFQLGDYPKAIVWFKKYEEKPGKSNRSIDVEEWIRRAEFAQDAVEKNRKISPKNLGANVNSDYDEYWPCLTADEHLLVFTVMIPKDTAAFRHGNLPKAAQFFQEDFYISENEDGVWQQRSAISPPLNSSMNDGAQTLSAEGNWMFFTGCGRPGSMGSCDIYFSQRTEYGWTEPVNLGSSINTPYWESQPSFSADGQTLYFVSNRIGGIGGRDIYSAKVVSIKDDGTPIMGDVKNLGPSINTVKDENSPFIHPNTRTLFFSSDGWPGMGEMDIFYSNYDIRNGWGKAINVGYPINTSNDEIGFIVNASGDLAYYSTDGFKDSFGGKDIYSFELPEDIRPIPVSYVKGFVYDDETKKRIGAKFELLSLKTGKLVVTTEATKYSGQFLICLPPGEDYAFNVSKPGYLFYSDNFNLEKSNDITKPKRIDIYLKPIKAGEKIILKNVFYETDSYQLKDESKVELNKLVAFLKLNPDVKIQISGHTDNVGSEAYNIDLSQKRAASVVDYLVLNEIGKTRLRYKGFGMSQPVAPNDTDEGRALNRRTEVKVIE